jgi:hypothetical protein
VGAQTLQVGVLLMIMGPLKLHMGLFDVAWPILRSTTPMSTRETASVTLRKALHRAKSTLGESDAGLGRKVGSGRKTVGRWLAGRSAPSASSIATLARLVQPIDASLALELVRAVNATHDSPALAKYKLSEEPFLPREERQLAPHLVDAVVCAACDAMEVTPKAVRPALLAAFTRVQALGIDVAALAKALDGTKAAHRK